MIRIPQVIAEHGTAPNFEGVYDVPETARYLRAATNGEQLYPVESRTLIRWIRRGLATPELSGVDGRDLVIGFEDVISLRVIAALRGVGVTWQEIDRSGEWLRSMVGLRRPFASESLWVGQGEVFTEWSARLISASRHGQVAFGLLRDYLIPIHGLAFSAATHLATSWEPITGVRLEPEVQFGSPCVAGTRIPTRTISGMIEAGDSASWVATAFDLDRSEVEAACEWESRLRSV